MTCHERGEIVICTFSLTNFPSQSGQVLASAGSVSPSTCGAGGLGEGVGGGTIATSLLRNSNSICSQGTSQTILRFVRPFSHSHSREILFGQKYFELFLYHSTGLYVTRRKIIRSRNAFKILKISNFKLL